MTMATTLILPIWISLFLVVGLGCDVIALHFASSFPTNGRPMRLARGVSKAAMRLEEFAKKKNSILVVDGNNVRGSARFRWNPVEVQGRIRSLCEGIGISRAVVVWDHGIKKFAAAAPPNELNTVDTVVVCSGLSQRADNVMVKESTHMAQSFCDEDWSSLCFVTSDMGLQGRLVSRANVDAPAMTSSTRPLLVDSTRFVELLSLCDDESYGGDGIDKQSCRVYQAQKSFKKFAKLRKLKYHPSREKTWHRCVLGEELRRSYLSVQLAGGPVSSFSSSYIQDLGERGYSTPASEECEGSLEILGPPRLDKRQRGILKHYNQAIQEM